MFIFRLCPRGVLFITWICHFNLINSRRREPGIEKCAKHCTMLQLTGTMDCYKNAALFSALLCSFYPIPQTHTWVSITQERCAGCCARTQQYKIAPILGKYSAHLGDRQAELVSEQHNPWSKTRSPHSSRNEQHRAGKHSSLKKFEWELVHVFSFPMLGQSTQERQFWRQKGLFCS